MNGLSRIPRPTLEFPSPLPSHSPVLRSRWCPPKVFTILWSFSIPAFGHRPIEPRLGECVSLSHFKLQASSFIARSQGLDPQASGLRS
ncbi:hypothetical protein ARMSODRAFT_105252 [Armillaria solidipes]|uniref:Uncharacterized protein n=1 Tax=Armillaria solidipes TaxID=1076256 RepID=A0A2H3B453_9AGAR|nr:hypothetical protein ARMSODRAFT_105252 [Armillaria solidipes]